MLKLSGQREEMIVLRCKGCVEGFDTIDLGFPMGLDAEIAKFVALSKCAVVFRRCGSAVH